MRQLIRSLFGSSASSLKLNPINLTNNSILSVPVRHRWTADKEPVERRFGYEDKVEWRGLLPRTDIERRVPGPPYIPIKNWSEKNAVFGQNDYIDILGDGSIHPTQVHYGVPAWLRGFKGNEYQMLLRKRKLFMGGLKRKNPEAAHNLEKRIRYLYKMLNFERRPRFTPKS